MTSQVRVKKVSARGIVATRQFAQGYRDVLTGHPPRNLENIEPNRKHSTLDLMWAYERGRLFACFIIGEGIVPKPLKDGRKVSDWAIHCMNAAIRCKALR